MAAAETEIDGGGASPATQQEVEAAVGAEGSAGCEAITSQCLVIENDFRDHLVGVSQQTVEPFQQTYQCLMGSVEAGEICAQINTAALALLSEYRAAIEFLNSRAMWLEIERLDSTTNGLGRRCFVGENGEIAFDGDLNLPMVQATDYNRCENLITSAEIQEQVSVLAADRSATGVSEAHFRAIEAFMSSPISGVIDQSILNRTPVTNQEMLDALKRAFHRLAVGATQIQTHLTELRDPELHQVYIFQNQFEQFTEGLSGSQAAQAPRCQSCANVFSDCRLGQDRPQMPSINPAVDLVAEAGMTFGEALSGSRGERCQARANSFARELFPLTAIIDASQALERVGQATDAGIMTRSEANLETALQYLNLAFGVAEVPGYSYLAEQGLRGLARVAAGGLANLPTRSPGLPSGLVDLAQPYTDARVPGGMHGLSVNGYQEGQFIRSLEISSGDLPYDQALRDPRNAVQYGEMADLPRVEVSPTDIVLVSGEHSGSASVVRLATLPDGRPVAIKSLAIDDEIVGLNPDPNFLQQRFLREAQGFEIADAMGIGPRFHGVYVDEAGRPNFVMDLATGDFPSQSGGNITTQTFTDFEEMFQRIQRSGQGANLEDFQFFVTDTGSLRVIDAGNFTLTPTPNSTGADRFRERVMQYRLELLREASPDVGRVYLNQLRSADRRAYLSTMDTIARWNHDQLRHLYEAYEDMLIEAGSI
ncbi:MAG: hypothetical protein HRT45_06240 [Bdellovibrionales bacterium]|nr:hypothetical protein [Bdellovibrionales bacterium]